MSELLLQCGVGILFTLAIVVGVVWGRWEAKPIVDELQTVYFKSRRGNKIII